MRYETDPITSTSTGRWRRYVVRELFPWRYEYFVDDCWKDGRLDHCEVMDQWAKWHRYQEGGDFPTWTRRTVIGDEDWDPDEDEDWAD